MAKSKIKFLSSRPIYTSLETGFSWTYYRKETQEISRLDGLLRRKHFLWFQGELLLAAEASMATQRADLESHLRTFQAGLQDKQQELNKIQEQLEKVGIGN